MWEISVKHFFRIILVFLISFFSILNGKEINSLRIEFKRAFKEENNVEIVTGTIYYQHPQHITSIVKEPLSQWMILTKNRMELYYPNEKKAFRFTSKTPFQLSFFNAFIGVTKKDYGLLDMGYSLYSRITQGDTVVTKWKPPRSASKHSGDFILSYVKDKLSSAELLSPEGASITKTFFSNHIKYNKIYYPLEISTVRYFDADTTYEEITYSEPQFDIELPHSIISFCIPDNIEVEEIEW